MTLLPSTAAVAYHDALATGRRFRTLLLLVLFIAVAAQIGLFLAARFVPDVQNAVAGVGAAVALTNDPDATTGPARITQEHRGTWHAVAYSAAYATLWLGMVTSVLLSITLAFVVLVMLSGRTVGVDAATRAFVWSLPLLAVMIPWQAILAHPDGPGMAWRIPGVLYTWEELRANVPTFDGRPDWLGWLRFTAWPALALVLLAVVTALSGRGVKQAFGEYQLSNAPAREPEPAVRYEPVA